MGRYLVFRDFGGDGPAELTGLPGAAKQASIGGPFPAKGTTADAHAEPTALARRPAHRVPSLLHRADVCDLPCHGRRVLGPAGPAHRHRHAGRCPACRFFATARWSADQLGLVLLDLICATLVPADAPLVLAVDDTLWHRTGRKLHGAAWHHDGNGPGRHRPAWGHRWVVVGVIVHLPFLTRAVCLPILARLWQPGDPDHTPLVLAREL